MVAKVRVQMPDCDAIAVHLLNKMWHGSGKPYSKMNQVRRNLFGFSRHNSESRLLDKRITDMAHKSSEEWNFDFLNEIPQTGRYVWQRVHCYDVPVWYAAGARTVFKKDCCALTNKECVDTENSSPLSKEECTHQETEDGGKSKKPRLVQTSMKDFTRVQKRRSSRRLRLKQLNKSKLRKHVPNTVLDL